MSSIVKNAPITVLGANGMLATDLVAALHGDGYAVTGFDRPVFDITNAQQLAAAVAESDAIINCAAYTNVDGAETQRDVAMQINGIAVGELGTIAAKTGAYVIHVSSDFVYDGTKTEPYTELDPPNPVSYYGLSKWEGERRLMASGCRCAIVRLQWTYGHAGPNFVTKIRDRAQQQRRLQVVDDQIGSPTATTAAADAICRLLQKQTTGLFLFAARGYATRLQIAQFIVERLNLGVEVTPCRSSDFPTPAKRPLNSRFDCGKIDTVLGLQRESWSTALAAFLNDAGHNVITNCALVGGRSANQGGVPF